MFVDYCQLTMNIFYDYGSMEFAYQIMDKKGHRETQVQIFLNIITDEKELLLAISNDSLIKARIVDITKTDERNFPIIVNLEILDSKDVTDMPNFTKDKIGQTIKVCFRQEDEFKLTDTVNDVHVEFSGDERGGRFFGKFNK